MYKEKQGTGYDKKLGAQRPHKQLLNIKMRKLFYGFIAFALVLAIPSTTFATYLTDDVSVDDLIEMTPGQVPFGVSGGALGKTSNLFWDNDNSRLGVGTAASDEALKVAGGIIFGAAVAEVTGTIQWNSTEGHFQVYNGTEWIDIDLGETNATNIALNSAVIQDNATAITNLQNDTANADAITALQTGTGLGTGTDLGTFTGATIADASTVKTALQALETGLESTNSNYVPYTGATGNVDLGSNNLVIAGLVDGIDVSDLDAEVTALQTLTGEIASATAATHTGTNYIDAGTDLGNIDELLDTAVGNIQTATGVVIGATDLGTFTGTTIADASTVKAGMQALETALETNTTNITANDGDIADILTAAGIVDGDTDLGTFTGATIADASTIKTALQALETGLETAVSNAKTAGNGITDNAGVFDLGGTLTKAVEFNGGFNVSFGGATPHAKFDVATTAGITLTDTAGGGITLADEAGGGIYLDDQAGGGIYFDDQAGGGFWFTGFSGGGWDYDGSAGGAFDVTTVAADGISLDVTSLGSLQMDSTSGMLITDSRTAGSRAGLQYAADYSGDAAFGDRSLVDKGYVDSEIASAGMVFVKLDGSTYALPDAATVSGKYYVVKDNTGAATALAPINITSGGGTIDGIAAGVGVDVEVAYGVLNVYSDGSDWYTF